MGIDVQGRIRASEWVQQHNILIRDLVLLPFILLLFHLSSFAAFQETLWGARPAALVGVYTALADDANAPSYNPAGISLMAADEITITYAQLYTGVDLFAGNNTSRLGLGYFSYIPNIMDKRYGSFGFSWSNFQATHLLREDTFAFTYADSLEFARHNSNPVLSYGLNLKYLKRSFQTDSLSSQDPVFRGGSGADAVTVDVGLMYRPHFLIFPGLKFGAAILNVTEPDIGLSSEDRVPARYSLGVAYQDRSVRWLNPAIEISKRDDRTILAAAYEGWFMKDSFAIRFGGNEDQLGGGFGYQFRAGSRLILRLDYAILWPLDVEGTDGSHRISITTNF